MNNRFKWPLATLALLLPMTAHAHGEEVLVTFLIEFILLIVFIVVVLMINLNGTGKLIISALYMLAAITSFIGTDTLPFRENMMLINIIITIVPWTVFLLSYFALRQKFKKDQH